MHINAFFLLVLGVSVLPCSKADTRCDENDSQCITTIAREIVQAAVFGNDTLGLKSLDPMYQEFIEDEQQGYKFWVRDSTVLGFQDLITNKVKYISPVDLYMDFTFPRLEMSGTLEIEGELFDTPLKANVKYHLKSTNLHLQINSTRQIYTKDGKIYFKHGNIKKNTELLGTMHLDQETEDKNSVIPEPVLQNLNGDPENLLAFVHKVFIDENIGKLIDNINELHGIISVEEFVIADSYKE